MACSDYQTECLKVVTIGYLKSFIGNLVQNSTNGNPISIQRSDDTYCPTYSELTGGRIIQTWSQGTTPKSDRDGITVSSKWAGGSSGYSANQLVDQRDLGLNYTRFRTLSISRSGSGEISECGGSATLTYTYSHTRYTKSMNDSCVTSTSPSNVNSPCGELRYHTTYGSVSNCTSYSIGKNGYFSSTTRTDSVYATTTFRGSIKTSNSVDIKQKALTGDYLKEKSRWEVTTNVTATATSVTSFDCPGGEFSARGTRTYNVVGRFAWVDSCNVEYSQTQDRNIVTNQRQDLGSQTGSFSYHNCCDGGHNETKTLTFSSGSYSASVNFSQNCDDCSSTPKCETCEGVEYSIYPDKQIGCDGGNVTFTLEGGCSCASLNVTTTSITFDDTGSTESITYTLVSGCELSWSNPDWVTITDNGSSLSCTASAYSSGERTGTITLKVNGTNCKEISVSQGSEPSDCFLGGPDSITVSAGVETASIGYNSYCDGEFAPIEVVDQGTLEDVNITHTSGTQGNITFKFTGSTDTELKVKQTNGTGTLTTVVHRGRPTSAVTISWSGIPGPDDLATGGLMVTGSTYTAEFILGGPNAKKGTLYGTLTADLRDAMTFYGQFTVQGSGGGSIRNVCPGSQGEIYEVSTATWDYANKKLSVGFRKCS